MTNTNTRDPQDLHASRDLSDSPGYWDSLNRVVAMRDAAHALAEFDAADRAYREHVARYQKRAGGDLFHGYWMRREAAEIRHQEAVALGLSPEQEEVREELLRSSMYALDLLGDPLATAKLAQMKARLLSWLQRYPADPTAKHYVEGIEADERLIAEMRQLIPELDQAKK